MCWLTPDLLLIPIATMPPPLRHLTLAPQAHSYPIHCLRSKGAHFQVPRPTSAVPRYCLLMNMFYDFIILMAEGCIPKHIPQE